MAWLPMALSLAGAGMSAMGQQQAGEAQLQASNYNAAMRQAEALAESQRIQRESDAQLGKITAARAKSGVTMEGTPLLVMGESAANAELDILNTQWSAETASNLYRMEGQYAKQAGNIGAGTSLLSGASSAFGG